MDILDAFTRILKGCFASTSMIAFYHSKTPAFEIGLGIGNVLIVIGDSPSRSGDALWNIWHAIVAHWFPPLDVLFLLFRKIIYILVFCVTAIITWKVLANERRYCKCIFSCDQAALQMVFSVCLSVCPSVRHTFLTMFPSSYHHKIFRSYYPWPT